MDQQRLHFYLYRGDETSHEMLMQAVVLEVKNFVFDRGEFVLEPQGYSGIPLVGQHSLECSENDLCKVLDMLFRLSRNIEGLVFRIATNTAPTNPFYIEALKNDVIPRWANSPEDFMSNVFGSAGVLHAITPEVKAKFPDVADVDIIRKAGRETRNILVTESVKQRIDAAAANEFGMQRTSVNLPQDLAYIARQRPDLLSAAIREFRSLSADSAKKHEKTLESSDCVMVHILLNEADWKTVTDVADIESPNDIVSHRVSLALLEFEKKYSSVQNGVEVKSSDTFRNVDDAFEREQLEAKRCALLGRPHSLAHQYQLAKSLTTNDGTSSAGQNETGDDEPRSQDYARKQVFKKKREFGKKKTLAKVASKSTAPQMPAEEEEHHEPTSSGQLRNFERAVNGMDTYRESSDGDSLGEEEEMDLFLSKPKKVILNGMRAKQAERKKAERKTPASDDEGFDVADLLRAAPPLAKADDFDDFDDI